MTSDLFAWLYAVASHFLSWLGLLSTLLWVRAQHAGIPERGFMRNQRYLGWFAITFLFLASFQAWREEHAKTVNIGGTDANVQRLAILLNGRIDSAKKQGDAPPLQIEAQQASLDILRFVAQRAADEPDDNYEEDVIDAFREETATQFDQRYGQRVLDVVRHLGDAGLRDTELTRLVKPIDDGGSLKDPIEMRRIAERVAALAELLTR